MKKSISDNKVKKKRLSKRKHNNKHPPTKTLLNFYGVCSENKNVDNMSQNSLPDVILSDLVVDTACSSSGEESVQSQCSEVSPHEVSPIVVEKIDCATDEVKLSANTTVLSQSKEASNLAVNILLREHKSCSSDLNSSTLQDACDPDP